MKSSDFRTLRELTGLSSQEVAEMFGIRLRTCLRWDGLTFKGSPPEAIIDELREILRMFQASADELLDQLEAHEHKHGCKPEQVTLTRFWFPSSLKKEHPDWRYPHSVHFALIRWLYRSLVDAGHTPEVVWSEHDFIVAEKKRRPGG